MTLELRPILLQISHYLSLLTEDFMSYFSILIFIPYVRVYRKNRASERMIKFSALLTYFHLLSWLSKLSVVLAIIALTLEALYPKMQTYLVLGITWMVQVMIFMLNFVPICLLLITIYTLIDFTFPALVDQFQQRFVTKVICFLFVAHLFLYMVFLKAMASHTLNELQIQLIEHVFYYLLLLLTFVLSIIICIKKPAPPGVRNLVHLQIIITFLVESLYLIDSLLLSYIGAPEIPTETIVQRLQVSNQYFIPFGIQMAYLIYHRADWRHACFCCCSSERVAQDPQNVYEADGDLEA